MVLEAFWACTIIFFMKVVNTIVMRAIVYVTPSHFYNSLIFEG
jgi:hypothetical protein